VAIGLYLLNSTYGLLKRKSQAVFEDGTIIKWVLVYIFIIFLTGKIFSNPFHIWYVPLIAIFPFKNVKKQLFFISMVVLMLLLDTTPYIRVPHVMLGLVDIVWFRGLVRFVPMFLVMYQLAYKKDLIKTH
jgi:hypothetical protein